MRGMQNTETLSNFLAKCDPRPAGIHVQGWVCHAVSTCQEYFCPSSLFKTNKSDCWTRKGRFSWEGVWSITLVADWRKLVLVIQTDRTLSKFMLGDDLTLLSSTVFRVTWEQEEELQRKFITVLILKYP